MDDTEITEIASGLEFPEGPIWMADGTVLCVELQRRTVDRVHPGGRIETVAQPGGSPNGLAIGPDGAAYVANSGGWGFHDVMGLTITSLQQPDDYSGGRIERVDLATGETTVLYTECAGNPLWGPNDLVFDTSGGMWFTDHGKIHARSSTHGGVYYARPDGTAIDEVIYPLDSPNGIGLSPDGSRLYVAETHTGRLFEWGVTGPGQVERLNPLAEHGGQLLFGGGGYQLFDSLAVDSAGNVVVGTLADNAGLTVVSADGGQADQVALPDPLCTNVCFGGDDLRTAYATLSGTGRLVSLPWPRPGLALAY
ncbi:MAG TPA: SMP-30/gluconolactonase/LRE family protein [Acidimicrobiia bacterium]|nr:SMP-30/gluconolactonase/LRE family protein [Acidimicrobiia bacterium]